MSIAEATLEAPVRTAAPAAKAPYLHQIDFFRLLTFACVILIHVVGATNYPQDVTANAVEAPLHFTREAFFALTGFVLVYQYRGRSLRAGDFWRRRLPLVAIPYFAWSVFFWAYSLATEDEPVGSAGSALLKLLTELIEGDAWYHLYFLLVTMQVYLLFPLLMKLLRATAGRHRWLLLASGALQVAVVLFMTYPPGGVSYETITHLFATVVPYQFYALLGAVVAMHFEAVHAWIGRYRLLIAAALVTVGVVVELVYFGKVGNGDWPQVAADPFQPYLIPWFLIVIAALYAVSTWWAARRRDHHFGARFVAAAANRSFSIFLVHPLALALLGPAIGPVADRLGAPWTSLVIYLATITGTVLIVELLRRLPCSRALTGRPRLRPALPRRRQPALAEQA
ncbi:acyltransferase [Amycolatopsis sp. H20-H5]|uniref:acyltransferase n=1 Tax=Amycolatopsis sp. H20-H5 TaxID=3046309 RepID=UPI002DBFA9EA|nr:acyltransferase [Amycolatopsis sp. H20-H5]MEC3980570.1 acyltransferase [Amycolatopsis sp. H20-H5]